MRRSHGTFATVCPDPSGHVTSNVHDPVVAGTPNCARGALLDA